MYCVKFFIWGTIKPLLYNYGSCFFLSKRGSSVYRDSISFHTWNPNEAVQYGVHLHSLNGSNRPCALCVVLNLP